MEDSPVFYGDLLKEILSTLQEIRDTLTRPADELSVELAPEEGGVPRCTHCGIELYTHWGYVCGDMACPARSTLD